jgi:Tfp pilus assembly protein PilO|tara:strand:- start:132 stop:632 length:501 start_codon:yes stop_codon:yes gene_type:complete
MEGVGYWLIIAVLYLLSAFMKKRKQQDARRKLEQEDSVPDSEQKQTLFQAEFLQDLFGDMKNMAERSGLVLEQEKDDIIIPDADESIEYEQELFDKDLDPELIEPLETVFKDISEQAPKLLKIDLEEKSITHHYLNPILRDRHNLKRAIVLKEILDKPRAMKRAIR